MKLYLFIAVSLQGITFGQAPIISYTTPQAYATGTAITPLTPTSSGAVVIYNNVSTFAGNGTQGSADGTASAASFNIPYGVAVDGLGNAYVVEQKSHKIRKISPAGAVTAFAGNNTAGCDDGTGTAASFNYPRGLAVDASGNVYVADAYNNKIRKVTSAGEVTTLAGSGTQGSANGAGTAASFYYPFAIAVDASGNIYVADTFNNKIRKITPEGVVSTLAGCGTKGAANGKGKVASFNAPYGVTVDASSNVYVADSGNNLIRKITPAGMVTTLAGGYPYGFSDGKGTAASFYHPSGVVADASGNVYVADTFNNKIRKITAQGQVSTLVSSISDGSVDGTGTNSSLDQPYGLATDTSGNLYVTDIRNNKIRKISTVGSYTVTPQLPAGLSIDSATGIISGTSTTASPKTTYTVTAGNNAGISTTTVDITVNAVLGVEDMAFKNMVVYPNPTKGEVNIGNALVKEVNVYNNAGQLVKTVINSEASNDTTVQLNNLPMGIYYMNIEAENGCAVRKVIRQ